MRKLLPFVLGLTACAFVFDGQAPTIPVEGPPVDTANFPRLNVGSARSGATIIPGTDGAPWAIFEETLGDLAAPINGWRLVRLTPPETSEVIALPQVLIGKTAVYVFDRGTEEMPKPETTLTVRSPGEPLPGAEFTLPNGGAVFAAGKQDRVFVYWPITEGSTQYLIQRRDKSFQRLVPMPPGVAPDNPPPRMFTFSDDEEYVIARDRDDRLLSHSTRTEQTIDLGVRSKTWSFAPDSHTLIICGADGLRSVPVDGAAESVLDASRCEPNGGLVFEAGFVHYGAPDGVRRVPLDASAAPTVVAPTGKRALVFGDGAIAYSTDPDDQHAHAAGDGWLGGWRFMTRGIDVTISAGRKVHWLENAAKSAPIGDLHAATEGGRPRKLALNVAKYDVLPDGRVLAADDQAYRGDWNRIIVIDEAAGSAQSVAAAGTFYTMIPGSTDILVDVVTGPDDFNIVRVPIPPRR
jgi:hypothetical protein